LAIALTLTAEYNQKHTETVGLLREIAPVVEFWLAKPG